jgi:hypothetical protein
MGVVDENGNPLPTSTGPILRGGFARGRARGAPTWRGRGRGRGGRAALTLDNRTSSVRVTLPADQPQLQQESGVRQLFQAFGPLATVEVSGESAVVKLSSRKAAEAVRDPASGIPLVADTRAAHAGYVHWCLQRRQPPAHDLA